MKEEIIVQRNVVEAEPGWYAVFPVVDDDDVVDLFLDPVVAWAVVVVWEDGEAAEPFSRVAMPVTVDCAMGNDDGECLLSPDGRYIFPYETFCDSREEALALIQAKRKREKERKAR